MKRKRGNKNQIFPIIIGVIILVVLVIGVIIYFSIKTSIKLGPDSGKFTDSHINTEGNDLIISRSICKIDKDNNLDTKFYLDMCEKHFPIISNPKNCHWFVEGYDWAGVHHKKTDWDCTIDETPNHCIKKDGIKISLTKYKDNIHECKNSNDDKIWGIACGYGCFK